MTMDERQGRVRRVAEKLYAQNPDWITFYREILGLHGMIRQTYPAPDELAEFEQTETFHEIQQMLTRLREQGPVASNPAEPTRVITVRLPRSLHEALRVEAHEHRTSMNKLCISKLLQFIEEEMIPAETWEATPRAMAPVAAGEEESSE